MRAHHWRNELISEALGGDYLTLLVSKISLTESLLTEYEINTTSAHDDRSVQDAQISELSDQSLCTVELNLHTLQGEADQSSMSQASALKLRGEGVGFIDASFEALVTCFEGEYPSLRSIRFASFEVRGELEDTPSAGADALCRARLIIENSERAPFEFEASQPSMASVSLDVVVQALEHFINAERAFVRIYRALEDAKSRGRHDLIESYTSQLSELVKTTSYTESIAQLRSRVNI
jgi:hypothetical protein